MQLSTIVFCLLTLLSITGASVIPIRRVQLPPSVVRSPREIHRRHAKFIAERDAAAPTITVTAIQASSSSSTPLSTTQVPSSASSSISASSVTTSTSPSSSGPTTSTIAPGSQPSQPPADNDGSQKYVFAHHMVGNTFPYTVSDWAEDISLAHAAGIDAFALNMGTDDWQPARVNDAYEAAKQSGLDFKLFLSLDMSSFPCASPTDAQALRNLVNSHVDHPNQLQYSSRAFVSTFAGETCQFGQGSVPNGWKNQFTQHPDLQGKIYFVPAFFIDPATFKDFSDVMDGDFNWNSGWPIQVTTSFAQTQLSNQQNSPSANSAVDNSTILGVVTSAVGAAAGVTDLTKQLDAQVASVLSKLQLALTQFIGSTDTDKQHLDGLAGLEGGAQKRDGDANKRAYMGAVTPWFFTHYGPDSFNKNFVFLSDQHLYSRRWESIIAQRDQFDLVEVITWNDYGESHYIGPIKGSQPNSQAWTDGMNHTAWLDLTQYYATAFKTGSFPTIETDKIFMWSRPHPTKAQAPDSVPQPTNFELFEDAVWAVVMATEPSTVTLQTSDTQKQTFDVPAGVTKLAVPIGPGGTMKGTIERGGKTVVELAPTPEEFTFQGSPKTYNFNAFVTSASAVSPPS